MGKMKWCALLLATSTALAQSGATGESKTAMRQTTATKRTTTRKTTAPAAATAADIQALRSMIEQQNQALQEMRQQLQQRDAQMQQLQQSVQQAQTKATSAESEATQQKTAVTALQSDVTEVKSNFTQTALSTQEDQKRVGALEAPTAIHYKGITITPGGFIELGTVIRNRNENSSLSSATGDANIPFPGSANGTLSEFRFDSRHSRISLKGEGKVGSTKVTGYYEVDFMGAAPTANENQSNSFNVRQRQLWGMVNFANGISVTGGQQWSLFTLTRKAMEN